MNGTCWGRLARYAGKYRWVFRRPNCRLAVAEGFITLEDETGQTNVIVWPKLIERQRRELLQANLLGVVGEVQNAAGVLHVLARRLIDESTLLGGLVTTARNFR